MSFNDIAKVAALIAEKNGFFDMTNNLHHKVIVNMTKEEKILRDISYLSLVNNLMGIVSEAVEAYKGATVGKICKEGNESLTNILNIEDYNKFISEYEKLIKSTVEEELVDILLRTLVELNIRNIDIDTMLEIKMRVNRGRDYLHGKIYG